MSANRSFCSISLGTGWESPTAFGDDPSPGPSIRKLGASSLAAAAVAVSTRNSGEAYHCPAPALPRQSDIVSRRSPT